MRHSRRLWRLSLAFFLKFWHFSKQFKTTHGIVTWSRVCSDLAIVFGGHCHTKLCVFLSEETWRHLANMQIMYYNINVAPRAKFQFFWHIVKASLTLIFENVDVYLTNVKSLNRNRNFWDSNCSWIFGNEWKISVGLFFYLW